MYKWYNFYQYKSVWSERDNMGQSIQEWTTPARRTHHLKLVEKDKWESHCKLVLNAGARGQRTSFDLSQGFLILNHASKSIAKYLFNCNIYFQYYHICIAIVTPSRSDPERRQTITLNFYFHISLWLPWQNLARHDKEVWKSKFKLIFILIQLSEMHRECGHG